MSAANGYSANGPSDSPHRRARPAASSDRSPFSHSAYQWSSMRQPVGRRQRPLGRLVLDRPRRTEVVGRAHAQHTDRDVSDAPRDGRERRRLSARGTRSRRRRRRRPPPSATRPRTRGRRLQHAGHRLPQVLVVGQAVETRPQVMLPMPVELLDQLVLPVDRRIGGRVHGGDGTQQRGPFRSWFARQWCRCRRPPDDCWQCWPRCRPDRRGRVRSWRAHLDVTVRTVRRDIDRLRQLGYPIDSDTGVAGGYRLGVGGAAVPPLMLDTDEAFALAVWVRAGAPTRAPPTTTVPTTSRAPASARPPGERSTSSSTCCRHASASRSSCRRPSSACNHRSTTSTAPRCRRSVLPAADTTSSRSPIATATDGSPNAGCTRIVSSASVVVGTWSPATRGFPNGARGASIGSVAVALSGHRFELTDPPDAVEVVQRAISTSPYRHQARVELHAPAAARSPSSCRHRSASSRRSTTRRRC